MQTKERIYTRREIYYNNENRDIPKFQIKEGFPQEILLCETELYQRIEHRLKTRLTQLELDPGLFCSE
ncbi:MAG: hypothetical protein KDD52_06970 [Bdellovibrionales bacterium]|nr:hypothetical protein [Bdellovibrionales bacterium]